MKEVVTIDFVGETVATLRQQLEAARAETERLKADGLRLSDSAEIEWRNKHIRADTARIAELRQQLEAARAEIQRLSSHLMPACREDKCNEVILPNDVAAMTINDLMPKLKVLPDDVINELCDTIGSYAEKAVHKVIDDYNDLDVEQLRQQLEAARADYNALLKASPDTVVQFQQSQMVLMHNEIERLRSELADIDEHNTIVHQQLIEVEKQLEAARAELRRTADSSMDWNNLVEKLSTELEAARMVLQRVANSALPQCDQGHGRHCDCLGEAVRGVLEGK